MKNWLLIIFPCCRYVSTYMRSAFSETLVLLDLAYVCQDSQKLYKTFFILCFQGPRNIFKYISHHSFSCARTFPHRVDTCTRMTNEQLIFHIYGSHCEIYIYIYICGTWGPLKNHSGSILLLSSPFTNTKSKV